MLMAVLFYPHPTGKVDHDAPVLRYSVGTEGDGHTGIDVAARNEDDISAGIDRRNADTRRKYDPGVVRRYGRVRIQSVALPVAMFVFVHDVIL